MRLRAFRRLAILTTAAAAVTVVPAGAQDARPAGRKADGRAASTKVQIRLS